MAERLSYEALSARLQQVEEELSGCRNSHQKLTSIMKYAPFLIMSVDRQWRVQEANSAVLRLMGHSEPGEVLGLRCGEALGCAHHVDDPRGCGCGPSCGKCAFRMSILDTFETGKRHERVESRHYFIGDSVPERTLLVTTALPEGQNEHVFVFVEDITERKRAEEERERMQAQLVEAKKMESVGRLAGGVAHDFNNMLGVIIGNAEMAGLRIGPDEPLHRYLQAILKASNRSAETVRQLLAFAGEESIDPEILDLNDTVSGMLTTLRSIMGADIELILMPGRDLGKVKMDPSQVNKILANLAMNSRDAIAGVGRVTIETGNVSFDERYCEEQPGFLPGEFVLLSVSDTGVGMPKDVVEHLFEPFFTTKVLGKGAGMGLATVYGIVKQNNGFVDVCSEPGKGTTFKIYIPRFEGTALQREAEDHPPGMLRGTETILIVDDEQEILSVLETMLESLGYTVLTADTPMGGIRLSGEHPGTIHLLVTDVEMPLMSGKTLAENLRLTHRQLRCLFMSGYTGSGIAYFGMLERGVDFIHKPFSMMELAAKLREVLDQR